MAIKLISMIGGITASAVSASFQLITNKITMAISKRTKATPGEITAICSRPVVVLMSSVKREVFETCKGVFPDWSELSITDFDFDSEQWLVKSADDDPHELER